MSPGSGRARYRVDGLALPDFQNFPNAISPGAASVPSHASFEVVWGGGNDHQKIRDADFGFAGDFVAGDASISFTAWNDGSGVTYTSDAGAQTSVSAGVGHERNGAFFS